MLFIKCTNANEIFLMFKKKEKSSHFLPPVDHFDDLLGKPLT